MNLNSIPLSLSIFCIWAFTINNLDLNLSCVSILSKILKWNCALLNLLSGWQIHEPFEIIDRRIESSQSISICLGIWRIDNRLKNIIACISSDIILSISVQSFKLNEITSMNNVRWAGWTGWKIYVVSVNLRSVFALICAFI